MSEESSPAAPSSRADAVSPGLDLLHFRDHRGYPSNEFYDRVSRWANSSDRKYRTILYVVGCSVDLGSGFGTYRVDTITRKVNEALEAQDRGLEAVSKTYVERRIRELVSLGILDRTRKKSLVTDAAGRQFYRERAAISRPAFQMAVIDGMPEPHDFLAPLKAEESINLTDSETDSETDGSSIANPSLPSPEARAPVNTKTTPEPGDWVSGVLVEAAQELLGHLEDSGREEDVQVVRWVTRLRPAVEARAENPDEFWEMWDSVLEREHEIWCGSNYASLKTYEIVADKDKPIGYFMKMWDEAWAM